MDHRGSRSHRHSIAPAHFADLSTCFALVSAFLDLAIHNVLRAGGSVSTVQWILAGGLNLGALGFGGTWFVLRRLAAVGRSAWMQRELLVISGVVAVHTATKIQYLDLVPRWDSGVYFGQLVGAIEKFSLSFDGLVINFRFADHPTQAYAMYLAIGQFLFPHSHRAVNAQNLILAILGIGAFWALILRVFPDSSRFQRTLAAVAFAFSPIVYGTGLAMNADFPVAILLVVVLAAFVWNRPVILTFAGTCLVFSKEPGVLFYGIFLAGLFVFYGMRRIPAACRGHIGFEQLFSFSPRGGPSQFSWQSFVRLAQVAILLLPILVFYTHQRATAVGAWAAKAKTWDDNGVLCFGLKSGVVVNALKTSLVLNFHWVLLLGVLAYVAKRWIWPEAKHRAGNPDTGALVQIVGLLLICSVALNCLYINYLNPRYYVTTAPLLILLFFHAVRELFRDRQVQSALLSLVALLSIGQTWHSLDPISERLWGTFKIGDRTLVDVGGDLQGKADGMAYNAQWAAPERLYRKMISHVFAREQRPTLIFGINHFWLIYINRSGMAIDNRSLEFSMQPQGTFVPEVQAVNRLSATNSPRQAVYVALPWLENVPQSLEALGKFYRIAAKHTARDGRYFMDYYELERL